MPVVPLPLCCVGPLTQFITAVQYPTVVDYWLLVINKLSSVNCIVTNDPGAFRFLDPKLHNIKLLALIEPGASHSVIISAVLSNLNRKSESINISVSACNRTANNNV